MTRTHTPSIIGAKFTDMNTRNIGEAMYLADHNFEVEMTPLKMDGVTVWDKQAVRRVDNGAYLGTVGLKTRHIQPVDFYGMAGNLLEATGGRITKTITMARGAVIGCIISIDDREYVQGDSISLTVIILTSYNSKFAILGRAITKRFICLNQVPSSTKLFNIKNTTGNLQRLNMATKMLGYYGNEVRDFDQKMKLLTNHKMSTARALEWYGSLLPQPSVESSQRAVSIYDNKMSLFANLLENGLGTNLAGVKGTAYGAWNALTELQNHHAHTRVQDGKSVEEVKFESNLLGGQGDKFMSKGFNRLVEIAKTVPSGSIV